MIRVSGLYLYPVKSLKGFCVSSAEVDALGFSGDWRFLVVDEVGRFITQRTVPRMALVSTALAGGFLHLSSEGAGTIAVPTAPDLSARLFPVSVWSHADLLAEDCGKEAAAWLGEVLGTACRLVRIGPAFHRTVTRDEAQPGDVFSFADGAPLLVTTTDQFTGQRGKEPLKTLASFRRAWTGSSSVVFGVNLIQKIKFGLLNVGDLVVAFQ